MREALGILVLLICTPAHALDGTARVVDGDTLVIGQERIRLRNYNAPEIHEPGGPQAKAKLERLTNGKQVHCDPKARDRYARLVATCSVDGRDLGREMKR